MKSSKRRRARLVVGLASQAAFEGPIGGSATIHVDAVMPNFVVQEICGLVKPTTTDKDPGRVVRLSCDGTVDRRFALAEKPGLGFDLSEASLAKYRFGGAHPMARVFHEDGSVAEW